MAKFTAVKRPAIMIPCEGSRETGNPLGGEVMCAMCGSIFSGAGVPAHSRADILAMIERGDFDG